ncbi:MAG: GGDEF domain-containing protein [Candidatus Fermentibacteraceae bacterium]|nr:GGDEF domain-containing protein [Candidatus Fermentibacteraceae bacterium]MBN2609875.1 GGDEF domain-containing protein [Candidatus Fermentibacteraceae bacterium]
MSFTGFFDPETAFPWRGELDAVTGIPPRKALDSTLPLLLRRMGSEGLPLSSLMIDIDHFKKFNDKWGHSTGDIVLRHVAGIIRRSVGYRGEAYRYGGEEIMVLLPNTTLDEAFETAERIRDLIYQSPLDNCGTDDTELSSIPLIISVSVGVSSFPGVEGSELLVASDKALYQAKNEGRNRVCIYSPKGRNEDGMVTLDVTFPAASSISEGSYIILTRWFRHRDEMTEIEAREISDPSRGVREIAEGRNPDGGYVTAEINGRVTSVERRVDKTFFTFEVKPETLELMYNHLKDKGT